MYVIYCIELEVSNSFSVALLELGSLVIPDSAPSVTLACGGPSKAQLKNHTTMHLLPRSILALAFAAVLSFSTSGTSAADKKAPKDNALRGKISSVDKEAKTITVGGTTVTVDETTVITDSGKPAKLENLKAGTEAAINTFMLGEKLIAVSIKIGVVAVPTPAAKKKK